MVDSVMKNIFFNEDNQREFSRKGYTIIPFLSDEETDFLLNETCKLLPLDKILLNANNGVTLGSHTTFLDSDVDYKTAANKLINDLFDPKIKEILIDYKIAVSGFVVKPGQCGEVGLHRDWTLTRNIDDVRINLWCPLVDIDQSNGILHILDGAHRLVLNVESPYTTQFHCGYTESLKKLTTAVSVKAGQVLVFDNSILHWSRANTTSDTRYVAATLCIPTDAKPAFYYPDEKNEGRRFQVFDMDGEAFLQHSMADYYSCNIRARSLGFVENKNKVVSQDEFLRLLSNGDKVRQGTYSLAKGANSGSFLTRLKRLFDLSSQS